MRWRGGSHLKEEEEGEDSSGMKGKIETDFWRIEKTTLEPDPRRTMQDHLKTGLGVEGGKVKSP